MKEGRGGADRRVEGARVDLKSQITLIVLGPFRKAGNETVFRGEDEGGKEEDAEDEDDRRAGRKTGVPGEEESSGGTEGSEQTSPPKEEVGSVGQERDGGRRGDEQADRKNATDRL